jgi:hypothetical protein
MLCNLGESSSERPAEWWMLNVWVVKHEDPIHPVYTYPCRTGVTGTEWTGITGTGRGKPSEI